MKVQEGNLFAGMPDQGPHERFDVLLLTEGLRLERIVSTGQATAEGEWLAQDRDEWVVLLRGGAGLQFDGESGPRVLGPGDHLLIPAGCRHRVEWTMPGNSTIWLALHFTGQEGDPVGSQNS